METSDRRSLVLIALYAANILISAASVGELYTVWLKASLPVPVAQHGNVLIAESSSNEISSGDTIASVDHTRVRTESELDHIVSRHEPAEIIPISLKRNGVIQASAITLARTYSISGLIVRSIAGLIYLIFGFVLLIKRPNELTARVVNLTTLAASVLILESWGYYGTPFFGVLYRSLFLFSYLLVPVFLLHFGLIFPRKLFRWNTSLVIRPLYVIAAAFAAWLSWLFVQAVTSKDILVFDKFDSFYTIAEWFFGIVSLTAFACFILNYRRSTDISERKKISWVLVGVIFSVLFYLVFEELPQMFGTRFLVSEEIILLASTIAPVTFTIAIVRYHVFDINLLINRATGYIAVGITVFAVYAGLLVAATAIIGGFIHAGNLAASSVAAILTALLFEPLRKRVQRFVDKTFFRVRYNYREAQKRVLDAVSHALTASGAAHTLAERLAEILGVEWALVVRDAVDGCSEIAEESSGLVPKVLARDGLLALTGSIPKGWSDLMEQGAHFEPIEESEWPPEGEHPALVIALRSENAIHLPQPILGALALGQKWSRQRFSIEDVDLAESVARQASLAIERSQLTEQLLVRQAEALREKQLNELKSLFVSSVSHDLKTPLTSIKLFVQLLAQQRKNVAFPSKEDEASLEYLHIIDGESDRLQTLIDNVLDHARIERGAMEYHFASADLNSSVKSAVDALKYLIEMQGFGLSLNLSSESIPIEADTTLLHTALTNILSNAIKYSGNEKRIEVKTYSKQGRFAIMQITDSGVGISPSDLEHIFEPYFRSNSDAKTLQARGTGLGLANVKHVVEAHRGTVEIDSKVGEGTTVTIRLPLVG